MSEHKLWLVTILATIVITTIITWATTKYDMALPESNQQRIERLEDANKTLIQQAEQSQHEKQELEKRNQELEKQLQAKRAKQQYLASLPSGCQTYEPIVRKYFGDATSLAMAVMRAESGCNSLAVNNRDNHGTCTGSFGAFQLGCFWMPYYGYAVTDAHKPEINVKLAHKIYTRQGNSFKAWGAYTNGAYLKYY